MNSEKYVKFNNDSLKLSVLVFVNSGKFIEFGNSYGICKF